MIDVDYALRIARESCCDGDGTIGGSRVGELSRALLALRDELDATESLVLKQASILTGVANALRGEPAPLATHSHHDLAERAAAAVRECDGLRTIADAAMVDRDVATQHLRSVLPCVYMAADQTIQCPECLACWWDCAEAVDENWHAPGCVVFATLHYAGLAKDVRRSAVGEEAMRLRKFGDDPVNESGDAPKTIAQGVRDAMLDGFFSRLGLISCDPPEGVDGGTWGKHVGKVMDRLLAKAPGYVAPLRATAPTDAEIEAHGAVGGVWMVRAEWVVGRQRFDVVQSWAPQIAKLLRDHNSATWWFALDATHMPCAWPVVPA